MWTRKARGMKLGDTLNIMIASAGLFGASGCNAISGVNDLQLNRYGTSCDGGACESPTLINKSTSGDAESISLDKKNIYWTTTRSVWMMPKGSLGVPTELAKCNQCADGVAADGENVYWITTDGTVNKVSVMSRVQQQLASGQAEPSGIAVFAGEVYWTNSGDGTVMKVSADGGDVVQIAAGQVNAEKIAVDSTGIYWVNGFSGGPMTLNGSVKRRASDASADAILSVTPPEPLEDPLNIAIDSEYVYWTNTAKGTVERARKDGTTGPEMFASGQENPCGIKVQGDFVYWTEYDGNTVQKMPADMSTSPILVALAEGPHDVAVDDTNVYWLNDDTNTLMAISR